MNDRRPTTVVELVRLGIVGAATSGGFALAGAVGAGDAETARLLGAVLGALVGYVVGGVAGRLFVRGVDRAQERLRRVEAMVIAASSAGTVFAVLLAALLLAPVVLLPYRAVLLPVAFSLLVAAGYAGGRIGAARGGDLGRYLGVRGGLEVASPSRGGGVRVVDSSALVDGRLVEIARAGFLDGTLVVPMFVVHELQGLADASEPRRRSAGRRGLDVLKVLQQEHLVPVEVTEDDPPGITEVDAKLAAVAEAREAALLTTDSGLRRVAEVQGLRVLDVSRLADAVKPPAAPGDRLEVLLTRAGTEQHQAVGHLADGSMVVVERAQHLVGDTVTVEVTSVTQSSRGRLMFAVTAAERDGDRS